jgi:hypothetical protein
LLFGKRSLLFQAVKAAASAGPISALLHDDLHRDCHKTRLLFSKISFLIIITI